MVIVIGENFFEGLQVVFGSMLVWSEVGPFSVGVSVLRAHVRVERLSHRPSTLDNGGAHLFFAFLRRLPFSADYTSRHPCADASSAHPWSCGGHAVI